jgi:hypothetical protein
MIIIIIKRILTWILALLKYYNGSRELVRTRKGGQAPSSTPPFPSLTFHHA